MGAVSSPEELDRRATALAAAGGTGFLLSGGCDRRGRVPLGPYLGTVGRIRDRTGLGVNLHTGLVGEEEAIALLASGADAFSTDVVQDPRTIAGTLHLDAAPGDYRRTLELLSPGGKLVPHVCVGLQSEQGEERTLDLISAIDIRAVIVLGLVPSKGTSLASAPVDPGRVVRFIARAAEMVSAPIILGCMRSRSDRTIEIGAIEAGASGIVNPSAATVAWARERGLRLEQEEVCCALHP